ncbi:MAG: hypothetical protein P1P76_07560 [Anaerolineales bacterium]|nr:hypothetical protein [Anaerolineales bacterium]
MNLQSVVVIGLAFALTLFAVLRTVPNRRILTIVLLLLPLAVFSYRWSLFRRAQWQWLLGIGIGAGLTLLWWLSWGRRLQPPDDSSIRVWTEEEPFE